MSPLVRSLEPLSLWNFFADLNAVPRASKQEARVIEFAKNFGTSLGLETLVDSVGNVIIRKAASAGMEDRTPIVMQSHLDMVHQKNNDTQFDFATQGINMVVEGDWVHADGTTLGADNGIGVATIMAILAADNIPHPPLEALFTIDEETGMTGAKGLEGGLLHGQILLNLDTEDDRELTIGCAGGVDVTASGNFTAEAGPADSAWFLLSVKGLKGGHSGMDIHLGRANANKVMNRILLQAAHQFNVRIASIDGGGLRNAIPREAVAHLSVPADRAHAFERWMAEETQRIVADFRLTDPHCQILCHPASPSSVISQDLQTALLAALAGCHSGIYRMSPDMPGLVETSNNLARVWVQDGKFQIACLTRSSVNSQRDELASSLVAVLSLTGADVKTSGDYPGWQPAPDSAIVRLMSRLYVEMFGQPAQVAACHAGLECGILGTHYPQMDMISFGPNIRGAHSPDEKVQISSVQKFWKFLLNVLTQIPPAQTGAN